MAIEKFDPNNPDQAEGMRSFFGPLHVDEMVRQAIQACWMSLPAGRKNIVEVEKEVRRIVDRALHNLREDADAFGLADGDDTDG